MLITILKIFIFWPIYFTFWLLKLGFKLAFFPFFVIFGHRRRPARSLNDDFWAKMGWYLLLSGK